MPAVLLVLAFGLGAIEVVVQQARLTDAAADGARSLARGDAPTTAITRMAEAVGDVSTRIGGSGDFICVTLDQSAAGPAALTLLSVTGKGCALGDAASGEGGGDR